MDFSSKSLFPARKREAVNQGGTRGVEQPKGGEPREMVSSNAGRTSETAGAFDAFTLTKNNMSTGRLITQ